MNNLGIELSQIHWVYLAFIIIIIICMVLRRDTSLVCIVGIFLLGIVATWDIALSVMGVFNSFIYATRELMGTILIISVITAMSNVLMKTGITEAMVLPFTKLIKSPALAYWIIGILMMFISWFFWPSPAVALLGAVLLPVAVKAGLPRLGVAVAMNFFGHGIALSSDFIIQGAPKLTADAAGIPVSHVISASVPLVIIMGVVTTVIAFYFLNRDIKNGKLVAEEITEELKETTKLDKVELSPKMRLFFSLMISVAFLVNIFIMSTLNLQGGDATALIGGTAVFILIIVSIFAYKKEGLEMITIHLIEGLQFGFRIFGAVIPIAAFFYLGDAAFISTFGEVLPVGSEGIVNDIGVALANAVPVTPPLAAVTLTGVGAITGLDGSGFSGISLAGSVAQLFSMALGYGVATLTALGQIAAIWVGGGTLIPWAVIPAAAICGVDPFDLARWNLKPVVIGLIITTIAGVFLL